MSFIWTIIIGFLAGVIAKFLMPGPNEPSGFILTTILGIVGAFVASHLGQAIGFEGIQGLMVDPVAGDPGAVLIDAGEGVSPAGELLAVPDNVTIRLSDIPLSNEALRFYKSGPPFLHNYLPFWIAELTGKLIILLIPILGLLYPMTQFLPRLYDWAMRSKVLRMYGELRFLEDEITDALSTRGDTSEMIVRLDRLDEQANHVKLPVAYASMLYSLRDHIDLVREKIRRQGSS